MSFLRHLYEHVSKYQGTLLECMTLRAEEGGPCPQLCSLADRAHLVNSSEILEQQDGQLLTLIQQRPGRTAPPEELVLRVQGFLVQTNLPPVRRAQIPSNPARIINLRQAVTVSGLGTKPFDNAVAAVVAIYQHFGTHLQGNTLRTWSPSRLEGCLTLEFGNRYFTPAKFAEGEPKGNLSEVIDPYGILQPHLTTQIHTQENVVEYWEHSVGADERSSYKLIKPESICPGTMVELQVAFAALKIGPHEYIFLPKLRAICVLSRAVLTDYNTSALKELSLQTVSPLKKLKRKIGYGDKDESITQEPRQRLKRLTLQDQDAGSKDISMSVS